MIRPHYTALLQPCDVGIKKSLKDRLKKCGSNWRREKHGVYSPGSMIPAPTRIDVLNWLKKIGLNLQPRLFRIRSLQVVISTKMELISFLLEMDVCLTSRAPP